MPSYIVKINKEEDFYVYWSDIVEAPHVWGTRDHVTKYMLRIGEDASHARFDRANETGTSAMQGDYDWDDHGFIYMQQGFLRREDLAEFLGSYGRDDEFDLSLLEPFEDDEEEDA